MCVVVACGMLCVLSYVVCVMCWHLLYVVRCSLLVACCLLFAVFPPPLCVVCDLVFVGCWLLRAVCCVLFDVC